MNTRLIRHSIRAVGRYKLRTFFIMLGTIIGSAALSSDRVALIGENTAQNLFGSADPPGRDIQIGDVPFRVLGVLERFGTDAHGMDRDAEIVVPISTLQRRLLNIDTILAAKLLVKNPAQVESASTELARLLRERHAIAKGRPNDFHLMTTVAVQKMVGKVERVLDLYLPMGAGIAMLVAAILAATLKAASVNERIGEIGLRRAVGARLEDVQLQFIVETAATILGG